MADSPKSKRKKDKLNDGLDLVDRFLMWCKEVDLTLSKKVTIREDGCCHRFGMIALNKLDEGECIFKIPRNILLEPNTSSISEIIEELKCSHAPENSNTERHKWLPLLVTLLYEYTNPVSKWRPYLDLVPDKDTLNQPIFWNRLERECLNLIEMNENVDNDIKCIEEQYCDYVIPFIKKHEQYFDPKIHTLDLYKHLAGFLMAYSFTDNGTDNVSVVPAMVPMADILNHISDNNAHLEFGEDYLSMVTTQAIEKGAEVFNTYGQLDNCNLLRSYGFIENSPNPYDEVQIAMKVFQEVLNITDNQWQSKLSDFKGQSPDNYNEDGVLFCVNGCLCPEERLHNLFQVIHRDATDTKNPSNDINQLIEEKWESNWESDTEEESSDGSIDNCIKETDENSDEEDHEDYEWDSDSNSSEDATNNLVTYEDLHHIPTEWRQTLVSAAKICAGKIMKSMEFSRKGNEGINSKREAMVKSILHGRLSILKQVEQLL